MNNPFTSATFVNTWLKHFTQGKDGQEFKFLKGIKFYKHRLLPIYINVGKNLTKGLNYSVDYGQHDFKGKTLMIYDVPEYFNVETIDTSKTKLRCKKLFQYEGFALDFNDFPNPEDYIASRISSKNRRGYRSRLRRLEECFDIRYEFLYDGVDEGQFKNLFAQFHELLSKRFSEKHVNYHHLEPKKWAFYTEVVYKMIQEKKASLFTIYNGAEPIGITLSFHAEAVTFVTITVFDPDYYKFNVGKASLVKLLEWCYEHDYKIMDLSKGAFDFKYEWSNLIYKFHYHVLYDASSLTSRLMANGIAAFYNLKLFLRQKHVNNLYRKWLYKFKNSDPDAIDYKKLKLTYIDNLPENEQLTKFDTAVSENQFFRKFLYSFLFLNPEPKNDAICYRSNEANTYYIKGKEKIQKIVIG